MEFVFRCSLNSDGIKDKWIEVYEQIGEESNTRFVYGSKALTVVREIDRSSISTSMIGRGEAKRSATDTVEELNSLMLNGKSRMVIL